MKNEVNRAPWAKKKTFLFILALCAASAVWGEMTTGPVTYASIAKQNGWEANTYYQTLDWGGAISVTAKWDGTMKNGKSINNTSWRIYQKSLKGEFTIAAKPGFIIRTIKLTYATNNKGVCSKTANESPSTTATDAADQIKSGTVYEVNASSITLYVGVTEATTKSDDITISLQTIVVTYDYDFADSYLTEKFQTPDGTDWNFATSTSGTTTDGKYYTWEHGNIRYNNQAIDVLQNGAKAVEMRNAPNAYFQTVAEGGVKYISFCWNQADAAESSYPAEKLILSVGDESETQTIVGQAAADRCGDRLFSFFPVTSGKTNATIKLSNLDANRIIFGPITIVPYLRYTEKAVSVDIANETYDCTPQINNTETNSITYSSDNACVSFGEVNSPIATLNSIGTAVITATYGDGASTTFELTVTQKPQAEITFENQSVDLDKTFTPTIEVKVEDQTITPSITYSSNNDNVLKVNNGVFEVIGIGTAEVTATVEGGDDYRGNTAKATITVNNITPEENTFWKETFNSLGNLSDYQGKSDVVGDYGVSWILRNFRHKTSDETDKVNGEYGVRLKYNAKNDNRDAYIETNSLEGGVKRVQFKWKTPANAENPKFTVEFDEKATVYTVDQAQTAGDAGKLYECGFNANIAKNAKFTIRVTSGTCVSIFGPLTITPYLLYTKKEVEVEYNSENLTSYDATQNLINNTGETPTIALSGTNVQAQLDGDGKTINLENVTEDVTVTASWNEGKVTTTFTLKVKEELITPDFTYNTTEVNKTLLDGAFTNTLTMTEGCGMVTYTSSNENVAKVDENGEVTIRTAGTTTITATLIPAAGYKDVDPATYTLNVAKGELGEAWKEGFGVIEVIDGFQKKEDDIEGDEGVYNWKVSYYQRNSNDVIKEEKALRLRYDKDVANHIEFDGAQEGGIKAIAFDWKLPGDGSNLSTAFDVTVNGEKNSFAYSGLTSGDVQNYAQVFNVRKNTTFELEVPSTGSSTIFGPISITPYLLYKTKYVEVMKSVGSYVNTDIINNTNSESITFESSDPETAYIETTDLHKDKVVFLKTGTVTITATWEPYEGAKNAGEYVTTSYTLKINDRNNVDAAFSANKMEKTLTSEAFTNDLTVTAGDATPAYTSDNTDVAVVNASNGEVTIKGIGTAKITAKMAQTEKYYAWEGSYTLIVRTGIDESKKLVECFSQITSKNDNCTAANTSWKGDVTDWKVYNTRRYTNDTINGNNQATFIRYKGYAKAEDIEGGVKYFSFNWKQWAAETGTMKMTASIGGNAYSQEFPATDVDKSIRPHYYFAWNVGCKKNTSIEVKNESYNGSGLLTENGRITFDAFEIVPYLYYKTKSHVIDNAFAGATYINEDLINNIDNEEDMITYSLIGEGADDIASIDADGKVTVNTGGVVTVQAKWVPDDTKPEEFVTTTYTLTINFPTPDVEFTAPESKYLDGTIGEEDMNVTVTLGGQPVESPSINYTSSNENVIKITNNGWQIIGIGTTTITATVKSTPAYGQVSETADIKVTNITPAEGTYWKETFSSLEVKDNYNTNLTTIDGDKNVLKWKTRNFQHSTTDKVNSSDQGIRLRNAGTDDYNKPGYVEYYTDDNVKSQEGGIKRVLFQWRIPGKSDDQKVVFDVKYKEGSETIIRTLTYTGVAHETVYDYAQNFNLKNNNKLTIAGSTDSDQPIIIGPITIVPYLLYTEKIVSVTYDLEGTNEVDVTENLINNLEEGEMVTYSLSAGAQATISGSTITLANATEEVTVTATWGEVSTTYTLKVTKATPEWDYIRNFGAEEIYGTICVDHNMTEVQGATLWKILNYEEGMSLITIEQVEVDNTAAGVPYIYERVDNANQLQIRYGESETEEAKVANGLHGTIEGITQSDLLEGNYAIYNNEFRLIGTGCTLGTNKAYMVLDDINNESPVLSAPRRAIRMPSTPTNLVGSQSESGKAMKVLRDGQFYIIRSEKAYNVMGVEE